MITNPAMIANRVVCSAIKSDKGTLILGLRHFDPFMRQQIKLSPEQNWKTAEQGFVDNKGQFLTREQAFVLAEQNGQIVRDCGTFHLKQLFSENLY